MPENDAKIRLLIVDDDTKLCRLVRDYLAPMGYLVESAHTGPEGLEKAVSGAFQVVILDCMLPGMDGFEVLRRLRRTSTVPVLMLTALGDEADRIVGLEIGADDYLPKTFSTRELLARLRAVTRRSFLTAEQHMRVEPAAEESLTIRELRVIPPSRTVTINGEVLNLTPLEFDLLLCLVRSPDRVLSRDRLLDEISGRDYEVFDRSIDVHISSLRRKLGDDPKNPRFIKTVRTAGYLLMREADPLT
ncbi:MAG: response regulator transcription factor [Blastocatellia bacterium]|nr:response regulator transcription factor [Blastocatellia bacterium]